MRKVVLQKKNHSLNKIGIITIIISIFLMSIGYSAFRRDLNISDVAGTIEASLNIKINSLSVNSTSDINSYSNSSSYNGSELISNIKLDNINSWVKYELTIVNIGNTEMGIANYIDKVLPENLTYEIEGYNIKEPICDDTNKNKCTLNASKTLYITFKYKDGAIVNESENYSVNIKFDFEEFYNVIYSSNICVGCTTKAIKNTSFSVTLINYNKISVKISDITLLEGYTFDNNSGLLTIDNVTGDISIINATHTRIEYIESTGAVAKQYIDTGYTPNKNTTVVYDGMVIDGDTALFGVREASNRVQLFTLQYVSSNYYRASYKNSDFPISNSYLKNVRHVFKMDGNSVLIDNAVVKYITPGLITNFQGTGSLYLLAIHTGNTASNFGQVRLYSFKIYEGDTLIKNFIPVIDSSNKICLYETLGKTYHYNLSNEPLRYGELSQYTITNNITGISSSDQQTYVLLGDEYDTILSKTNGSTLPTNIKITSNGRQLVKDEEYTYNPLTGRLKINEVTGDIVISEIVSSKIDYIESTGTQYINTGHSPGVNTKVVMTYIPKVTKFNSWVAFFGYRNNTTNNDSFYVSSGSNAQTQSIVSAFVGGVHMALDNNIPFNHVIDSTEVISLSQDEFSITVDGIKKLSVTKVSETELSITNDGVTSSVSMTTTTPVFNTVGPIFIFSRNIGKNTPNYLSSIRLKSFQIYENNELVMDFEPIMDENGDVGLIDNISKAYFYNQGSQPFSYPQ